MWSRGRFIVGPSKENGWLMFKSSELPEFFPDYFFFGKKIFIGKIWGEGCRVCGFLLVGWWWMLQGMLEESFPQPEVASSEHPDAGKIEGKNGRGQQRMRWLDAMTNSGDICVWVARSCGTLGDLMDCSPPGSSVMEFPGKNTGVGCRFLLQGIFLTQELKPGLLHCRFFIIWATVDMSLRKLWEIVKDREAWCSHELQFMGSQRVRHNLATELQRTTWVGAFSSADELKHIAIYITSGWIRTLPQCCTIFS